MTATLEEVARRGFETWSRRLDLRRIADVHGTPLYIHHLPTLRRNLAAYTELVGDPGRVRYPVKANPSPLLLEPLAELGAGADCASPAEVHQALAAGVPMGRLTYNSPAPDTELAERLLRAGAAVVADSPRALGELAARWTGEAFAGRLLIRVNPGGLPGYRQASELHRYTDHGAASSQFGVPSEEVVELVTRCPLPVAGLHAHVGTQMDNLETFTAGVRFLHELVDAVHADGRHRLSVVNLGGGLGIPYLDGQDFPGIGELATALAPLLRPDLQYQVEPGNSLVGDAVALLLRVVEVKSARGRRWGIVDAGTDQLVKHTVAGWQHRIVDAGGRPLARRGPDALAGPLCFAGDVLLPATDLGDVRPGDPLLVQHAGAYCEAVASRFNGRRAPAQVVLDDDGRMRRARTAEDCFFEPAVQTYRPAGLDAPWRPGLPEPSEAPRGAGDRDAAETLDGERLAALASGYMRDGALEDRYRVLSARRTGERSYLFEMETETAVGFVALPFALRLVGDAAIMAVGWELGWQEKRAPVWATRVSMSCCETLASGGVLPCRVVVSHLAPGLKPGVARTGLVHYRLGPRGEVSGVARVVVPVE